MSPGMRDAVKAVGLGVATVAVLPNLLGYWIRSTFLGADRALEGSTQLLSLVPGVLGQYLRRAFLVRVLDECHPTVTVEFGTLFSKSGTRIGENVYIGPGCHIGLADIGRDVLIGPAVQIPSGPRTHGTTEQNVAFREQPGEVIRVGIGAGTWIGGGAVVMADVGERAVVAAGSVVTKAVPPGSTSGGVPARVLSSAP